MREPTFIKVTSANMKEVLEQANRHAFFYNGKLMQAGETDPIDYGDVVCFPWKDAVQQLADLVTVDDGD